MIGRMIEVISSTGAVVCKVSAQSTSIGASVKAGFPVEMAISMGRKIWRQKGDAYKVEPRGEFGTSSWRG